MKYIHRQLGEDAMYKTWHSHSEYMIIYTYSDGGSIVTSESTYAIRHGALSLVAPGKYHYTMPSVPCIYERSKLFLTVDEANRFFSLLDIFDLCADSLLYAVLPDAEAAEAESIFESLKAACSDTKYTSALLMSAVCRLSVLLDKYSSEKEHGSSDIMSLAVRFINDNITSDIGIDDVADRINMSKYHFCRTFKRVMGLTVMEYILKTRIMLAKKLLVSTTKSVLTVSEECAFSGTSYFCRVFKEEVGISPLQYRKKHRSN